MVSKEEEVALDRQNAHLENVGGETELPSYADVPKSTAKPTTSTSSPWTTKHTYSLNTSKGLPWLKLLVSSRAPSLKTLPVFLEGDVITGSVDVELDKPEGCKGVSITLKGENTAVGQESIPFVDVTKSLWEPSGSGKLAGKLSWPFELILPKEVDLPDDLAKTLSSGSSVKRAANSVQTSNSTYRLPPTFTERASPAYIDYKIIVTVKRGAFRVNQTLGTSFVYVPRIQASSPSTLRCLSYSDGSPLVGPEGDPEGWVVLPSVKSTGKLFDSKDVEVNCSVAFGAPLQYAVGSPVPLIVTISSPDSQALDLLAKPSSINVYLTRTIAIGSTATDETAPRRSNNTFPEHVGKAFFWPSAEGASKEGVRVLNGEIEIRRGLKPGFLFPRFCMRYHVSLFPFDAPGFVSNQPADQPLVSEKVAIVTENASGVFPRSYAPPGYEKPAEGNYNTAMGYLENGNQRFYHHHGFA